MCKFMSEKDRDRVSDADNNKQAVRIFGLAKWP